MSSLNISSSIVDSGLDVSNPNSSEALNWATEWVGYIALCMFSMVLVIPTLGIVGLMVWEYFSDEAERKAERKKEIDQAMQQHFGGGNMNQKKKKKKKRHLDLAAEQSSPDGDGNFIKDDEIRIDDFNENSGLLNDDDLFDDDDDDDEFDTGTDDSLQDIDDVMKQADCLLHKRIRRRKLSKSDPNNDDDPANNFDEILT